MFHHAAHNSFPSREWNWLRGILKLCRKAIYVRGCTGSCIWLSQQCRFIDGVPSRQWNSLRGVKWCILWLCHHAVHVREAHLEEPLFSSTLLPYQWCPFRASELAVFVAVFAERFLAFATNLVDLNIKQPAAFSCQRLVVTQLLLKKAGHILLTSWKRNR